jgi:hypothetical protein
MKKLAVFLVFGLLFSTAKISHALSAEEMASNCKGVANAAISSGQISLPTDFETGVCWGAFTSLHEAAFATGSDDKPVFHICFPDSASVSESVKVFLAYLDKHPEKLHESYFMIAVMANQAAFPCKSAP